MQPVDPLQVVITGREIYDAVLRLQGSVDAMLASVKEHSGDIKDHEDRLRTLERGRWPLPSLAVLIALASAVTAVVALLTRS